MDRSIQVLPSNKAGINSREHGVVVSDGVLYLRIVLDARSRQYELWTATASEDDGSSVLCRDQRRLIAAANGVRKRHGFEPALSLDRQRREFGIICAADRVEEFEPVIIEFFEIFDDVDAASESTRNEMRELYETLSVSDSGEAVYLHDGLWLHSDGSMSDECR